MSCIFFLFIPAAAGIPLTLLVASQRGKVLNVSGEEPKLKYLPINQSTESLFVLPSAQENKRKKQMEMRNSKFEIALGSLQ